MEKSGRSWEETAWERGLLGGSGPALLEQGDHGLAGLCALGDPRIDFGQIKLVVIGLFAGLIPAEFLEERTYVGATAIGGDDAEKGFLIGTHSAETNLN